MKASLEETGSSDPILREPRPGDLGWIVHRHGVLYAVEHGYDDRFEGLVARVVADFAREHDPARERCWIAEWRGEVVGSVFVVRESADPEARAKLRLLYVEPWARGMGLGSRLVDAAVDFARSAGYQSIVLWTQATLTSARRIYEASGFALVATEPHHSFGPELVAESWEKRLN